MAESRHALLVTSSVYDDPGLHALAAPRRDATLLARVLGDAATAGFSVQRLTNPTSWRAAQAVERFFSNRQWDDVLLLYFSGHGLKSDYGDLFFAMRNTQRDMLQSTSLPATLVHEVMERSGSQRQILLLDCCYGGAFSRLAKGDDTVDVADRLQGAGTVVLTASTSLQFAWQAEGTEGDPGESVFTKVVAEGLSTGAADLNGDGPITVLELHQYASKRIRELGAAQTPTLSSIGQEGELVIGQAKPRPKAIRSEGSALDLSRYVTIRDQGQEGSVVGMAVTVAMEVSLAVSGRQERLSARYAYAKARVLDHADDWTEDMGATIQSGLAAAKRPGVPLESAWPYKAKEPQMPPGETWKTLDQKRPRFRAAVFPISAFEEVPYHLARGRPIVTGLTVYGDAWYTDEATSTGWIEVAEDTQLLGGHAVVIVGFDGARDALKFANCWGEGWGDGGFGYIARKAVEQALQQGGGRRAARYWAIEVPQDEKHCLD